jgi:hypothetical protein
MVKMLTRLDRLFQSLAWLTIFGPERSDNAEDRMALFIQL